MMVRVVRVACLPGGLSIFVDDQPDAPVIWVLEADCTPTQADMLESLVNVLWHWSHKPVKRAGRATLRAV